MGKRGPAKTPTPILKLRGSWRAKERAAEPTPESGAPDCPEQLSTEAKQIWQQVVPQLERMGVLARVDGGALARYCEMFARWWAATKFLQQFGETKPVYLREEGKLVLDEAGAKILKGFMPVPQVSIVAKLSVALLRIEQEFGLTPSARAGLQIHKESESDPIAALMKRRKVN